MGQIYFKFTPKVRTMWGKYFAPYFHLPLKGIKLEQNSGGPNPLPSTSTFTPQSKHPKEQILLEANVRVKHLV
jgi:hypothetical protein